MDINLAIIIDEDIEYNEISKIIDELKLILSILFLIKK